MPLGLRAIGEGAISALVSGATTQPHTRITYFGSQSFATRSTDSPAHTYIPGRITTGLTLGRRLKDGEAGQFGSLIETNYGEIELVNADGYLDSLIQQYHVDGQQIRLKIGATEITSLGRERVQPYAQFATVYTSVSGEWTFEHDVVRLRIEHLGKRLQDRLQQQTYAGSGGINGTSDMIGRTVPTLFGECQNVTAQILDPAILTYDLHGGSIQDVTAVYDAGIALTADVNYATYTALAAATVPDGYFATCLAAGKIKLGTPPVGTVTADVQGDNTSSSGGYLNTHAGIMLKILTGFSGLASANIDTASFNAFAALQPATIGLFLPAGDQSTMENVLERLAYSSGAFVGQDRSGLYRVQRLDAPTSTPSWAFTDRDIVSIERMTLAYGVPWKAWGVGYGVNWTVQEAANLAAGVTQERRTFLESEYRYAYVSSAAIALAHATSGGAPLRSSLFLNSADATTEATRLIGFYNIGRALYRVVVKTVLFSMEIGQTVRLTYSRWDLDAGKLFVVVNIFDDADAVTTEFICFG